jgi:hypothetical protein
MTKEELREAVARDREEADKQYQKEQDELVEVAAFLGWTEIELNHPTGRYKHQRLIGRHPQDCREDRRRPLRFDLWDIVSQAATKGLHIAFWKTRVATVGCRIHSPHGRAREAQAEHSYSFEGAAKQALLILARQESES